MDASGAIKKHREMTAFKPDPMPAENLDRLSRALYLSSSERAFHRGRFGS